MSKFGIIVKNKIGEAKKKKAFTLVELIIVITVLAVLATIAFLNLNGYTWEARDSVRFTDLKNIQKTMELSLWEWNLLPTPDELKAEKVELQELPWVKWQEWLFWDESIKELRDLSQVPLDPKTKAKYRYLVSEDRKNYYLEVELEKWWKYILTNYGGALALNSAPETPKNPGGTTPTPPQIQDKDKYHPVWQTINAIVWVSPAPSDWIQNKQDLPSTTVYRWKNWTPGENSWIIEVVYPDSSITEINVTINYGCATWHTKVWNECKASTQACTVANWTWTQALQPNGTYGTCIVNTCNAWHTKVWNECKVNTQACTAVNWTWTQTLQPNGTYWACMVNTCNANFHKEWNTCTSNTKTCTAPNGTWTQTWNATENSYWACTVNTCNAWHTKVWNECKVNTQACTVANGNWTQTLQPNGTYWTCTASTCNANFHKEWNECVSNTRECTISGKVGSLMGHSIESGTLYLRSRIGSGGYVSVWSTSQTTKKWIQTWDSKTNSWWTCVEVNSKPTVSWVTWETTVAVWQQINLTINGADSDWDTLTYKSTNLPSGLTISWNKITWTRNTAWEVTFQVVASDGKVDSDPINIKVDFLLVGEMRLTYSGITNWETITLPYHWNVKIISIDWGDGWVNKCITNPPNAYSLSCVYTNASKWTYTIIVKWNASWFWNKILSYQSNKIINITDWNKMWITDLSYAFSYARNFNQPLNNFDTSKITNMEWMFIWASNFNQPLNNWNTWKVTNMSHMFSWATKFNQPLNNWNVSNVTNMSDMFSWQINFNQPLNNWNTWKVTNMSRMFYASKFNQNINSWDVSNVTDMSFMFTWSLNFNQPLNNWNVSNVTNMSSMFSEAKNFNQPLNNWNTWKVTNMSDMFRWSLESYWNPSSFNQNINSWDVSNVTDMSYMFRLAKKFNQPLNNWNVSNVTDMSAMFSKTWFNQNINNWNTSSVINMRAMFSEAEKFNQPLDNWDVSKVTNMGLMFFEAIDFNQPLNNWNVSNVKSMENMFAWTRYNQPLNNWNTLNLEDMRDMFNWAGRFNQNISNWALPKIKYCKWFAPNLSESQKPPKCR